MRSGIILVCLVLFAFPCFVLAQVPPDEAMAKLKARQQQRDAERSKPVTITYGQLEDMREEIRQLKAQLAALKGSAAVAAKPVVKHRPTKIELGMSKEDLMWFLRVHEKEYQIVGGHADVGVHATKVQTVVHRESVSNSQKALNGALPNTVQKAGDSDDKQSIERVTMNGKTETLIIGVMGKRAVVVGAEHNAAGASSPVYGNEPYVASKMTVTLTDDVITAIDAKER